MEVVTTRMSVGDAGTAGAAEAAAVREGPQAGRAPRSRPSDRSGPRGRAAAVSRPARRPAAGAVGTRGKGARKAAVPRGAEPGGPPALTLDRAREELKLTFVEFELALQLGEITTVVDGAHRPRVPAAEVARVRDAAGGAPSLLARIELADTTTAAELLGISRDRMLRLTRAGCVRPVRWYVNRYRALVWLYLVSELREFAVGSPALLAGRLPQALRAAEAAGDDQRARGWRSRRVAQLVRDAPGPWEEAAVWAALLGPEVTDSVVPDPHERSRLRTAHTVLPHGHPGPLADVALIRRLTVADHPDEIALALLALSDALHRARTRKSPPRPDPAPPPPADQPEPLTEHAAAVSAAVPLPSAAVPALGERPRLRLRRLLLGRRQAEDG
jgi:hypothetical protein